MAIIFPAAIVIILHPLVQLVARHRNLTSSSRVSRLHVILAISQLYTGIAAQRDPESSHAPTRGKFTRIGNEFDFTPSNGCTKVNKRRYGPTFPRIGANIHNPELSRHPTPPYSSISETCAPNRRLSNVVQWQIPDELPVLDVLRPSERSPDNVAENVKTSIDEYLSLSTSPTDNMFLMSYDVRPFVKWLHHLNSKFLKPEQISCRFHWQEPGSPGDIWNSDACYFLRRASRLSSMAGHLKVLVLIHDATPQSPGQPRKLLATINIGTWELDPARIFQAKAGICTKCQLYQSCDLKKPVLQALNKQSNLQVHNDEVRELESTMRVVYDSSSGKLTKARRFDKPPPTVSVHDKYQNIKLRASWVSLSGFQNFDSITVARPPNTIQYMCLGERVTRQLRLNKKDAARHENAIASRFWGTVECKPGRKPDYLTLRTEGSGEYLLCASIGFWNAYQWRCGATWECFDLISPGSRCSLIAWYSATCVSAGLLILCLLNSICLSYLLPACLFVCLPVCLSASWVGLLVCQSFRRSVHCPPVCLSVRQSARLSVSLFPRITRPIIELPTAHLIWSIFLIVFFV